MCGGWADIDLLHCVGGRMRAVRVTRLGLFSRTLVLRVAQVRHMRPTVGVQVVFDVRSDNSVRGPEKRL